MVPATRLAWVLAALLTANFRTGTALMGQVHVIDQEAAGQRNEFSSKLPGQRIAQSFVPSLGSIGFLALYTFDVQRADGHGATLVALLREDTFDGPIVARSRPIRLPDGFSGITHFYFNVNLPVEPGRSYLFEPVVIESVLPWAFVWSRTPYPAGAYFRNGLAFPEVTLWFREGPAAAAFNQPRVVDGKVIISWVGPGMIEDARSLDGPWIPVDCGCEDSMHIVDPAENPRKFFRLRS